MIERQIPWRSNRQTPISASLCAAGGVAYGLLTWYELPASATPSFAVGAALVLALASWFAWCAATWHVEFARRESGSYLVRNAGLLWALFVWSAQSYRFIRQPTYADAFTSSPFWIVFALIIPAPFALWGGVAMQYVFDSLSRKRNPRG